MNRPPHHLTDEALSALLDDATTGAGDRDARRQAEDHLAACEVCASRRASLDDALARLRAAPIDPVDELTRRRMITRAVETTAPSTDARRYRRASALAVAAVAVVVLGVVGAFTLADDDDTAQVASGPFGLPLEAENVAAGVPLDNSDDLYITLVGYESREALKPAPGGEVSESRGERTATAGGGGVNGSAGGGSGGAGLSVTTIAGEVPVAAPSGEADAITEESGAAVRALPLPRAPSDADLSAVGRCYRLLADSIPVESKLTAAATGTYQGNRAVVLAFRSSGNRLLAMILARSDCSILGAQSFR